ncbi:MAG TPA: hypothetical protein VHR17_17390 [Thermoanaerobaculia bacterium]|nr:hypothetical protein [Thermoanaerobaculia bacterium]
MNRGAPSPTSSIPTIATTSPVTSGGKSARSRRLRRDSRPSNKPAIAVMPKTSGSPPAAPAATDAEMYAGPALKGQRKPEPTGPRVLACRMVATPDAIIDMRMTSPACTDVPPPIVTDSTMKIQPTDSTNTCCAASPRRSRHGGVSSTP